MITENAVLQFLGYRVDTMQFKSKPDYTPSSEPIELKPTFNRTIQQVNDNEYNVTIGVELKQSTLPFDAELSLTGRFKYEGNLDVQKMLKINAVAILYPYVRSTLSLMTTLAAVPPVIVPTINLAQMFEREEQQHTDSPVN